MGNTLQQDIRVRIDTLITNLPQVKAFSDGLQKLKNHSNTKISFGDGRDVSQLAAAVEKLADAVDKIEPAKVSRIGSALNFLFGAATAVGHLPGILDGFARLKALAQDSPAIAAKLGGAGTAIKGFFSAVGQKTGDGLTKVKDTVTGLAAKLPGLASQGASAAGSIAGIGVAGAGAAIGVGALVVAIAAVVAAIIAIPAAAAIMFKLASSAADAGDHFFDLNRKTGVSVEILSSLAPAAEDSGSSIDELAQGVSRFNKKIGEAAAGSKEAKEDLKQFGIEPLDAINNQEAALAKVFKRIVELPPTIERGIAAQKAFGKSGDNLVGTIEAVDGDLKKQIETTRALGQLWTGPTAAAANQFNDKMAQVQRTVAGLAIAIGRTLIPELLKLLRILAHEMPQAGGAFAFILGYIAFNAKLATNAIILLIAAAKTLKDVPAAIAIGAAGGVSAGASALGSAFDANVQALKKIANTEDPAAGPPTQRLNFGGGGGGGGAKPKPNIPDVFESIYGFNRQQAESAFALVKDEIDRQARAVQLSYDERRVTVAKFYAEQLRLQEGTVDAEISKLDKLRKIEADRLAHAIETIQKDKEITNEQERSAKLKIENNQAQEKFLDLDTQIALKQRERIDLADELARKERDAARALQDGLQPAIDAIDRSKGLGALVDARNQVAQIDAQIAELRLNGEDFAARLLEEWSEVLTTVGQVYARIGQGQRAQLLLDAQINTIREKSSQNVVTQYLGEIAVNALLKEKLAIARETLLQMLAVAGASKDPEVLVAIENQRAAIARLKNEYRSLGQTIKDTLINSITDGFANLIVSINGVIAGTQSLADAFRQFALSVIQELERVIAKMIAMKIIAEALKLIGAAAGGGGEGIGSDGLAGAGAGLFASGGDVRAAPGGRLIRVAEAGHDEMVVSTDRRFASRTAALLGKFIRRTGILPKFDGSSPGRILSNLSGRIPSFAAGDWVSAIPAPALAGDAAIGDVNLGGISMVFPNVRDARGFRLNEQAITREAGRAIERGLKKSRGSRD